MSRFKVALVVFATTLVLTVARPGSAAVFGIELSGSYNTYSMSAFNDTLQSLNQSVGTTFPDITSGFGGPGLALRVWPNPGMLLRFTVFDALDATSDSPPSSFDVGALAFTATSTYYFPSQKPVRFGLGVGIGWYDIVGTLEGPGGRFDLTGGTVGFLGQGEAAWSFARRWSVTGVVGYRYAKVDDMKADDLSTNTEVDFSGLLVRVGMAYDWVKKE
jgi:hypothetical protein